MVGEILSILGKVAGSVADRVFPDPCTRAEAHRAPAGVAGGRPRATSDIERAAAEVVKAEAQGQSWIQRTWRPVTVLTFVGAHRRAVARVVGAQPGRGRGPEAVGHRRDRSGRLRHRAVGGKGVAGDR